jgi:hypothetical protein
LWWNGMKCITQNINGNHKPREGKYFKLCEHLKCDIDHDENDKRINKKKLISGKLHYTLHNSFP